MNVTIFLFSYSGRICAKDWLRQCRRTAEREGLAWIGMGPRT
jgi:hypothetical protein